MIAVPVAIGLWATMMSTMPTLQGQPEHDKAGATRAGYYVRTAMHSIETH